MGLAPEKVVIARNVNAPVAKLVYAPDLGSGDASRAGSSPVRRTPREAIFLFFILFSSLHLAYHASLTLVLPAGM